jgi:hypothetical protein
LTFRGFSQKHPIMFLTALADVISKEESPSLPGLSA